MKKRTTLSSEGEERARGQRPDRHGGPRIAPGARWGALVFAMLLPSFTTWVYFVALAGHPAMRIAYTAGKAAQFAFPLIWLLGIERRRIRTDGRRIHGSRRHSQGPWILRGIGFGVLVCAAMVLAYFGWLKGSQMLSDAPEAILSKLQQIGAARPLSFLALASFYSIIHSFLEEYYWRWFVYGELRDLLPVPWAITVSSLGFMAHHVILLCLYFGSAWWLVCVLSLGVAAGGAVWAWLYERSGSLLSPWLSHLVVDAGLMALGYEMVVRTLRP